MKKVLLFFANGTEEVEALTAVDILRRAEVSVTVAGVGSSMPVGSHGIAVRADIEASELTSFAYDMVVIPGGMPGTTHLDESPIVDKALAEVHKNGGFLAAICAAPLVLGKRGYLVGKTAICYPGFESYLTGASLSCEKFCQDGKIITAAGVGAALDFALLLVEVLCGKEKADAIRKAVLA